MKNNNNNINELGPTKRELDKQYNKFVAKFVREEMHCRKSIECPDPDGSSKLFHYLVAKVKG